jgi:hypothetical protein
MKLRHTDARQESRSKPHNIGLGGMATAMVLIGCAAPMAEGAQASPKPAAPAESGGNELRIVRGSGQKAGAESTPGNADFVVNASEPAPRAAAGSPFALDARLKSIADSLVGDSQSMIMQIFDRFHVGGAEAVKAMDMAGKPPRTAAEAIAQGGDCTDLANIVIALMREKKIDGGAFLVHFDSAPKDVDHMVPFVVLGGNRIIVDLQSPSLNKTGQGSYSKVLEYTLDQAAAMYQREMGDYSRDQGKSAEAKASYEASLAIFERDPYVHQNMGILLEKSGDIAGASTHFSRAAELDPKYKREAKRGDYNAELAAAQEAADGGRWTECVTHLQSALESAPSAAAKKSIRDNITVCQDNAKAAGQ